MPQDLTPQLRTRLSRMERWVGVFVSLALLMLLFGLAYYIYQLAQRKGWFLEHAPYHTYVMDAAGLKVGDPVKLMGFDVGEITEIEAMAPDAYFNIYLQFRVVGPYYGYLWTDSKVKIGSGDFLGNRYLELTKGKWGAQTVQERDGKITGLLDFTVKTNIAHVPIDDLNYVSPTNGAKGYWLSNDEAPALTDRLDQVIRLVEDAIPNVLALTNQLSAALTNITTTTARAEELLASVQPIVTNLSLITSNLTSPEGSLGEWIIPAAINHQLQQTLGSANLAVGVARTNVTILSSNLTLTLGNIADLSSNLNGQVQANGFILSEISSLVVQADEMIQGLKRHWLLKGVFEGGITNTASPTLLPRIGGDR